MLPKAFLCLSAVHERNSHYRIAGKFGRELNFVVWQSAFTIAKLKSTKTFLLLAYNIICMVILFRVAKSVNILMNILINLMNISGYNSIVEKNTM